MENDRTLATYEINVVCTHLGCVVPWNAAENKFICPCHGSQYNSQGKAVRGSASLFAYCFMVCTELSFTPQKWQSLALAHVDILVAWVETDFRGSSMAGLRYPHYFHVDVQLEHSSLYHI